MRKAEIYCNGEKVGILEETENKAYIFKYDDIYFYDAKKLLISLTFPKNKQEYHSPHFFPFFFNLIAEGSNLSLQSRYLKIDKRDYFGILCATACYDAIGPITVKQVIKE